MPDHSTPPAGEPYSYEAIPQPPHTEYRIADAADNRVATCYLIENAVRVTDALNAVAGKAASGTPPAVVPGPEQVCGIPKGGTTAVAPHDFSQTYVCPRCGVHIAEVQFAELQRRLAAAESALAAEREQLAALSDAGIDLRVLTESYGWTVAKDGSIDGLMSGDMGYEPSGLKLDKRTVEYFDRIQGDLAAERASAGRLREAGKDVAFEFSRVAGDRVPPTDDAEWARIEESLTKWKTALAAPEPGRGKATSDYCPGCGGRAPCDCHPPGPMLPGVELSGRD